PLAPAVPQTRLFLVLGFNGSPMSPPSVKAMRWSHCHSMPFALSPKLATAATFADVLLIAVFWSGRKPFRLPDHLLSSVRSISGDSALLKFREKGVSFGVVSTVPRRVGESGSLWASAPSPYMCICCCVVPPGERSI